jgi:hypothetical protein
MTTLNQPTLVQHNYERLPDNCAIQSWMRDCAATSANAKYLLLGQSAGGRDIGAIVISAQAALLEQLEQMWTQPHPAVDGERLRVMITGGQHGNETASPEAVQQLVYELLVGELQHLPQQTDFIIIPIANPDGRDLASRENAHGINTNIDFILLSQNESQLLGTALRRWQPHTILDVHESEAYKEDTLARQGYVTDFAIQFEVGSEPNIDIRLREFGVRQFLPRLLKAAEQRGLRASRYIMGILDINAPITHGGLTLRNFRNYAGFHNVFSVLVEGRVDPPDGDYVTPHNIQHRTSQLYLSIHTYLQEVLAQRDAIQALTTAARDCQGQDGSDQLALVSAYEADSDQPRIGINMKAIDSGTDVVLEFDNHARVVTRTTLAMPQAYLVCKHQDRIAELLERHGIVYQHVTNTQRRVGARQRTIRELKITPPPRPVGRYRIELQLDESDEDLQASPGDLWIDLAQPQGRLVPLLLEPQSSTSIFHESDYVQLLSRGRFFIIPVIAAETLLG